MNILKLCPIFAIGGLLMAADAVKPAPSLFGLDVKTLEARWGKGTPMDATKPAEQALTFAVDDAMIQASFIRGRCEMLLVVKNAGVVSPASVRQILEKTGGGWTEGKTGWSRPDGAFATDVLGSFIVGSATWSKAVAALEKARNEATIKGL